MGEGVRVGRRGNLLLKLAVLGVQVDQCIW